MIEILKKILYLILILGINVYVCSWLRLKILARSELRRGFTRTRLKGFSYPILKLFRYLGKDKKANIWDFLIFVFSFLLWAFMPITAYLVVVDIDYSLLSVLSIYTFIVALYFSQSSNSEYGHIFSNGVKRFAGLFSFFVPLMLCIASIVMVSKSLSLKEILNFQYQYYNVIYQPLGFLVALVSVFFQMKLLNISNSSRFTFSENRDVEIEGFNRMVLRFSNYLIMFFLILLLIILYLGGWKDFYFLRGEIFLGIKFYLVYIFLLLLNRATPRLDNYTYLANINIRFLIPVAVVNFIATLVFFILRNIYGVL